MKVYLSPLAEFKLLSLHDFLEHKWGHSSKQRFILKLKAKMAHLSKYPESNIKSNELNGFYKCVVTPQTSLCYRIVGDEVEVITIFDNRQDPEKVRSEIEKYFK